MSPGRLIVFEGPEGVGKTTQINLLAGALTSAGVHHLALREPGGTAVGNEIRRLLLEPIPGNEIAPRAEALLFMASRAQLIEQDVRPALETGSLVLLDRFFLSTYAYQVAGRGLPEDGVRAANALATGGLRPDCTVLLSLPVAEGLARADRRGSRDRMEQAEDEFHARVAAAFGTFGSPEWQQAHPETGPIVTLDASGAEHDVFARVLTALAGRWPETFGRLRESHH